MDITVKSDSGYLYVWLGPIVPQVRKTIKRSKADSRGKHGLTLFLQLTVSCQHMLDKRGRIAEVTCLAHRNPERRNDEAETEHQKRSSQTGPGHQAGHECGD